MSSEQPKIEEIDEDGPPQLEELDAAKLEAAAKLAGAKAAGGDAAGAEGEHAQSKTEKKCRKAVEKLGLKRVHGFTKLAIKRQKQVFVVINPEVYRAGKNDGFVVFGEAKLEDAQASALSNAFGGELNPEQLSALQALSAAAAKKDEEAPPLAEAAPAAAAAHAAAPAAGGGASADEAGVEDKDIQLVMAQVSCTRAQAVQALRKNGNDIVNAIMSLQLE